jgi:DNA-binding transcriptional regulator YdaS (Cro superfamily)
MATIRQRRGLMAKIAGELGITRAAVAMWRRVPAERVAAVERITEIPKHELRPDLFDAPERVTQAA